MVLLLLVLVATATSLGLKLVLLVDQALLVPASKTNQKKPKTTQNGTSTNAVYGSSAGTTAWCDRGAAAMTTV